MLQESAELGKNWILHRYIGYSLWSFGTPCIHSLCIRQFVALATGSGQQASPPSAILQLSDYVHIDIWLLQPFIGYYGEWGHIN